MTQPTNEDVAREIASEAWVDTVERRKLVVLIKSALDAKDVGKLAALDVAVREERERCIERACKAACSTLPIYESNVLSRQIDQAIRSTEGGGDG